MKKHRSELTYNEQLSYYQEKKNTGMAFIVVSIILLIIGAVFFFLSYKYNNIRVRVFVIGLEFFVSVTCLAVAAILATLGCYFTISSTSKLKKMKNNKNN